MFTVFLVANAYTGFDHITSNYEVIDIREEGWIEHSLRHILHDEPEVVIILVDREDDSLNKVLSQDKYCKDQYKIALLQEDDRKKLSYRRYTFHIEQLFYLYSRDDSRIVSVMRQSEPENVTNPQYWFRLLQKDFKDISRDDYYRHLRYESPEDAYFHCRTDRGEINQHSLMYLSPNFCLRRAIRLKNLELVQILLDQADDISWRLPNLLAKSSPEIIGALMERKMVDFRLWDRQCLSSLSSEILNILIDRERKIRDRELEESKDSESYIYENQSHLNEYILALYRKNVLDKKITIDQANREICLDREGDNDVHIWRHTEMILQLAVEIGDLEILQEVLNARISQDDIQEPKDRRIQWLYEHALATFDVKKTPPILEYLDTLLFEIRDYMFLARYMSYKNDRFPGRKPYLDAYVTRFQGNPTFEEFNRDGNELMIRVIVDNDLQTFEKILQDSAINIDIGFEVYNELLSNDEVLNFVKKLLESNRVSRQNVTTMIGCEYNFSLEVLYFERSVNDHNATLLDSSQGKIARYIEAMQQ